MHVSTEMNFIIIKLETQSTLLELALWLFLVNGHPQVERKGLTVLNVSATLLFVVAGIDRDESISEGAV